MSYKRLEEKENDYGKYQKYNNIKNSKKRYHLWKCTSNGNQLWKLAFCRLNDGQAQMALKMGYNTIDAGWAVIPLTRDAIVMSNKNSW